jgi:hypothetical protein
MSDSTGGIPVGEKLLAVYRDGLKDVPDKNRAQVWRRLAEAGSSSLLCDEFLSEMLPWEPGENSSRLQRWRDVIFTSYPAVLDAVRKKVAVLLAQPDRIHSVLPLARELLPKNGRMSQEPGLRALYTAVIMAAPLDPAAPALPLPETTEGLSADAAARLSILRFLAQIHPTSAEPGWDLAAFPRSDPAWSVDVRTLPKEDRRRLIQQPVDLFEINRLRIVRFDVEVIEPFAPQSRCVGLVQHRPEQPFSLGQLILLGQFAAHFVQGWNDLIAVLAFDNNDDVFLAAKLVGIRKPATVVVALGIQ